jgi:hypothetical protein
MSFLVRLWRDRSGDDQPGAWQGEVEQIQTGTRWSFGTLGELLAFLHQAVVVGELNTRGNQTMIDHPMTNGDPNAILIVTRRETLFFSQHDDRLISPPQAESFSVAYSNRAAKWLILQPDGSSVPPGATFNVLVFKVYSGLQND